MSENIEINNEKDGGQRRSIKVDIEGDVLVTSHIKTSKGNKVPLNGMVLPGVTEIVYHEGGTVTVNGTYSGQDVGDLVTLVAFKTKEQQRKMESRDEPREYQRPIQVPKTRNRNKNKVGIPKIIIIGAVAAAVIALAIKGLNEIKWPDRDKNSTTQTVVIDQKTPENEQMGTCNTEITFSESTETTGNENVISEPQETVVPEPSQSVESESEYYSATVTLVEKMREEGHISETIIDPTLFKGSNPEQFDDYQQCIGEIEQTTARLIRVDDSIEQLETLRDLTQDLYERLGEEYWAEDSAIINAERLMDNIGNTDQENALYSNQIKAIEEQKKRTYTSYWIAHNANRNSC